MRIFLRACDRTGGLHSGRPDFTDTDIKRKCFKSLAAAFKSFAGLRVIGNDLSRDSIDFMFNHYPELEMENHPPFEWNWSIFRAFDLADALPDGEVVFFLEDDYLFAPDAGQRLSDFFERPDTREAFFHPSEGPAYYDGQRRHILSNGARGWFREVGSTTHTFACRAGVYRRYREHLRATDCDAHVSRLFGYEGAFQVAECYCPLPAVAAHLHGGCFLPTVNWQKLYKEA